MDRQMIHIHWILTNVIAIFCGHIQPTSRTFTIYSKFEFLCLYDVLSVYLFVYYNFFFFNKKSIAFIWLKKKCDLI